MAVILAGFKRRVDTLMENGSFSSEESTLPQDGDTMAPNTCCRGKKWENYIFILYLQVPQKHLVWHKEQNKKKKLN